MAGLARRGGGWRESSQSQPMRQCCCAYTGNVGLRLTPRAWASRNQLPKSDSDANTSRAFTSQNAIQVHHLPRSSTSREWLNSLKCLSKCGLPGGSTRASIEVAALVTSPVSSASNGETSIRSNQAGAPVVDPKANSLKTVKSVAFNVRRDVTSAARYVAASNVSSTRFRPS